MLTLNIHLGKGNVTRANVAEMEINYYNNVSNLLFRDNAVIVNVVLLDKNTVDYSNYFRLN